MFNLCTGYCFLLNVANCHILFYLSFTQHRNFIFIYFFLNLGHTLKKVVFLTCLLHLLLLLLQGLMLLCPSPCKAKSVT